MIAFDGGDDWAAWSDREYTGDEISDNDGPATATCKYCGQSGLIWYVTLQGKSRLADDNGAHYCPQYKATMP